MKYHVNVTVDQEVYLYHKQRGTKLSQTVNDFLKGLMLINQENNSLDLEQAKLDSLKKDFQEQMIKVSLAREQAEQEALERKEALLKREVEDSLVVRSIEEEEYWKETIRLLAKNPSVLHGRYKYYNNIFGDISFVLWQEKLGKIKEEKKDGKRK